MSDDPKSGASEQANEPAPEELHPQEDGEATAAVEQPNNEAIEAVKAAARRRRTAYRPSHKATFVGLVVVAVILIINAVGLAYILRGQAQADQVAKESVTLNGDALNKLGVSRNSVGTDGVELTVNPNANFGGKVTIAGDTTLAGQLKLNNKFVAPEGSFAKLQGGDTSVDKININGDATASTLDLRKDLNVAGSTHLQGPVTVSQLMTVNNNLSVTGTLSVGGSLAIKNLQIAGLTIGGHLVTGGFTPHVTAGGGVGSNGTVSASGNDTSGTIAVNVGVGAVAGTLANVTFNTAYGSTPHVVVSVVGRYAPFYINRNSTGFSIVSSSALAAGGYAFDFVDMQ